MKDVPRSTVIILLAITILVSVLGTIAVLSSTKIVPKEVYVIPPQEPSMGQNSYAPSSASGLVTMEVVHQANSIRQVSQ